MKDIMKLTVSVTVVCLFGAAALAYVNLKTLEPRKLAAEKTLADSLQMVMPKEVTKTVEMEPIEQVNFYAGQNDAGETVAYAALGTNKQGFGGEIKVLVGLSTEQKILAVMVTEHSETPGLGTKVTDRKAVKSIWAALAGKQQEQDVPPNDFLDAFAGRTTEDFTDAAVGASPVHAVSGATITSKAVLAAVNDICLAAEKLPGDK